MANEANRQINFRLPEEIAKRIEEEQLTDGKTLTEFAREQVIAASDRQALNGGATDTKELNLRGRLDELINEVIRIRMSLFFIAEYAQEGAFVPMDTLKHINEMAREQSPKTDYRTT
jgi:hypothetical protein